MSEKYDQYLSTHKANVAKGFAWLQNNLPDLVTLDEHDNSSWDVIFNHDWSKTEPDEYDAYDAYFYGGNKSFQVVQDFQRAFLFHMHRNPHHWQHWVLTPDNSNESEKVINMPYEYIIEMICDWWSFSWSKGDLTEIFSWYEERKDHIKLHPATRKILENVLDQMKTTLEERGS